MYELIVAKIPLSGPEVQLNEEKGTESINHYPPDLVYVEMLILI